ncbi:SDR family oxidoreductase [Streptomyces sp. GKU 257-1]|nr:SDR family oxidoreductase [Streptomyces sp. GKU 257-1]
MRISAAGRSRRSWRQVALPAADASAFTGPGAHVITGGTGALGLLLAEHLAGVRRAAGLPRGGIVLAARSAPGPEARARAEAAGARVVPADVADGAAVRALLAGVRAEHGAVSGVLHAAGVLGDGLMQRTDRAAAEAVLAAKVRGTVLLDEATRDDALDYFVLFSSVAAAFGNAGQTAYAFANSFLDHFAEQRERLRREGVRQGRTLAAGWPVWADGGMRIDAAAEEYVERVLGIRPLATAPGLEALEGALAGTAPRLLLAPGDPVRIRTALDGRSAHTPAPAAHTPAPAAHAPAPAVPSPAAAAQPGSGVREQAERVVLGILAEELRLPATEIDPADSFDHYGVDSLLTMSVTQRLEAHCGPLSKTLLFEYVTAAELIDHLAAAHPDAFAVPEQPAPPQHAPARRSRYRPPRRKSGPPSPVRHRRRGARSKPSVRRKAARPGTGTRSPSSASRAAIRRPTTSPSSGATCAPAGTASRRSRPTAGTTPRSTTRTSPSAVGRTYGKWGGFLRGADRFDPLFFRMSQIEAELTDPQERVFLETVWHLLEDAGRTRESLRGSRTGVFAGMMYGQYQLYGVQEALRGEGPPPHSSYASVANRVSYFFDFTGPSVAVDTMCSSALVAIHQACQAIRDGDCETAVAGGVNISTHPAKYLQLAWRSFLSEDGRCRSFGADGTGYVPSEGSGAVLLKRLDAALADGDRVLAVVKSSAVNHGGTGRGFNVPSPKAQGDLVRTALDRARMRPADLDYIEAHGTGTALGDPVEITGLLRAFDGDLPERLPIGSVKSGIGHAESAAGIAALTKVLLQMRHGEFAPSLHATTNSTPTSTSRRPRSGCSATGRPGRAGCVRTAPRHRGPPG